MPIRPYHPRDCDAVLRTWEAAARLATPFLPDEFFRGEREQIREQWIPMAETWVYEDGAGVVGFIALIGDEVGGFFVDPEHHGRGVGRALMDHARRLRGALILSVFAENAIGRRFYDRYGFKVVGQEVFAPTGHLQLRMLLDA